MGVEIESIQIEAQEEILQARKDAVQEMNELMEAQLEQMKF